MLSKTIFRIFLLDKSEILTLIRGTVLGTSLAFGAVQVEKETEREQTMAIRKEIITLIIGTVLGALLAFGATQVEKELDQRADKKKAMMCLKIELRPIKSSVEAVRRAQTTFGPMIPSSDITGLNMATQVSQFMFFDETLAEKVYKLSRCLSSINVHRQEAYSLMRDQRDPTFQASANMFVLELKDAEQLLNEINNIIHFE
jgi:hypothetical protein